MAWVRGNWGVLTHFSFIILVKDTAMDNMLGSSIRFATAHLAAE